VRFLHLFHSVSLVAWSTDRSYTCHFSCLIVRAGVSHPHAVDRLLFYGYVDPWVSKIKVHVTLNILMNYCFLIVYVTRVHSSSQQRRLNVTVIFVF